MLCLSQRISSNIEMSATKPSAQFNVSVIFKMKNYSFEVNSLFEYIRSPQENRIPSKNISWQQNNITKNLHKFLED